MDLLEFTQRHPWKPVFSTAMVTRFTKELVSSPELVLELRDQRGLRAAGVVIDEVQNPTNDACFEFLGLRAGEDERTCARALIERALPLVPARRAGMQLAVPDGSSLDADFLRGLGLSYHFSAYEMEKKGLRPLTPAGPVEILRATKENADEVFAVLKEAFAANLETSIPSLEAWRGRFLVSTTSRFYLVCRAERVVAFAHLALDPAVEAADVRMIGVLPNERGAGLGAALLRHCLAEAVREGRDRAQLSVAAANESALGLYAREGFVITEKYLCYRAATKGPRR